MNKRIALKILISANPLRTLAAVGAVLVAGRQDLVTEYAPTSAVRDAYQAGFRSSVLW